MNNTADRFGPLHPWQAMLNRQAELFTGMLPGASVGFVTRAGSGLQPGRHVAGLNQADGSGQMLTWEMRADGMHAGTRAYTGFEGVGVDLLFVCEDTALDRVRAALDGDALSAIKRLIREGAIMFYVMRTKYELQDAGYEDFLDTLGLAFLGACR
jgi:hypothetical protein